MKKHNSITGNELNIILHKMTGKNNKLVKKVMNCLGADESRWEDVKDSIQDVHVKFTALGDSAISCHNIEGYIFNAVKYKYIDSHKKQWSRDGQNHVDYDQINDLSLSSNSAYGRIDKFEDMHDINTILNGSDRCTRDIVNLRLDGYSYDDISLKTNKSSVAARKIHGRFVKNACASASHHE